MSTFAEYLRTRRASLTSVAVFLTLSLATVLIVFAVNMTASAQPASSGLTIQDLIISRIGKSSTAVNYQALVTISNSTGTDFAGVERVEYQLDDGDLQLGYILTALPDGESVSFTFDFALAPGEHTVRVVLGESEMSKSFSVAGADIAVLIAESRIKRGSIVEFDVNITNSGVLVARDLTLTSAWMNIDGDVSGEQVYDAELPTLGTNKRTSVSLPIQLRTGSYHFSFTVSTSTIEAEFDNNAVDLSLDVEFIDLRLEVIATESLGWDGDGNALMSMMVEVENAGVDDANTFYIGIECNAEWTWECSTSMQSDAVAAGEKTTSELRVWLPIGETPTRIFAVEDEDTFRWGDFNVIEKTITAPVVPEQVWTLNRISDPAIVGYWSDGSANVEFEMTLVNNGTDEPSNVTIQCMMDETVLEDCGDEITVNRGADVYPTVVHHVLRLPQGDTDLRFDYGADEPKSSLAIVPERIIGVERAVWDCFSDTSNLDPETNEQDEADDLGIGCAGWDQTYITKWPVGETIKFWTHGDPDYIEILNESLEDLGSFLNLEFESVPTKGEAQLTIHTGVAREDADFTGLDCIDFGGCAQTIFDEVDGRVTASNIAIWLSRLDDEVWRQHSIRATTRHELLHALTNMEHRHHDRTSLMSYDALDYTNIDGMDHGLFKLYSHHLVQPGMSFDQVLELIVFNDGLNDPSEPPELSAKSLLRRAHAAIMDAESLSFEIKGDWPGCRGNHDFGWAQLELANLRPYLAIWRHFLDGNDRYYYIGNPADWSASEWWLRRGRNWSDVGAERVSDATTFRGGFSSLLQSLADINVYANESDYSVISRTADKVKIEISIDEPNPRWSRGLNREISITVHPETYQISEYEMTWNFNPRDRDNCDTYTVRARSAEYGVEFTFPDAIREDSQLLLPEVATDESTTAMADRNRTWVGRQYR